MGGREVRVSLTSLSSGSGGPLHLQWPNPISQLFSHIIAHWFPVTPPPLLQVLGGVLPLTVINNLIPHHPY